LAASRRRPGTDDILTTLVLIIAMDWLIGLTKRMSV
jgi:hypothetical protein